MGFGDRKEIERGREVNVEAREGRTVGRERASEIRNIRKEGGEWRDRKRKGRGEGKKVQSVGKGF